MPAVSQFESDVRADQGSLCASDGIRHRAASAEYGQHGQRPQKNPEPMQGPITSAGAHYILP
jgi:hypothetical protein